MNVIYLPVHYRASTMDIDNGVINSSWNQCDDVMNEQCLGWCKARCWLDAVQVWIFECQLLRLGQLVVFETSWTTDVKSVRYWRLSCGLTPNLGKLIRTCRISYSDDRSGNLGANLRKNSKAVIIDGDLFGGLKKISRTKIFSTTFFGKKISILTPKIVDDLFFNHGPFFRFSCL